MLKSEIKVVQEGANGEAEQVYSITIVNGVETGRTLLSENVVKEKVDKKVIVGTKVIPDRSTRTFAWLIVGGYISSQIGARWGTHHDGIDIARPLDYTIKATDNGRVTFTGWDGSYGQKIVVMGTTGHYTGIHLHFEVRYNGSLVNLLSVSK